MVPLCDYCSSDKPDLLSLCLWPLTTLAARGSHQGPEGNSRLQMGMGVVREVQQQVTRGLVTRGVGQEWLDTAGCWKALGAEGVKSHSNIAP